MALTRQELDQIERHREKLLAVARLLKRSKYDLFAEQLFIAGEDIEKLLADQRERQRAE